MVNNMHTVTLGVKNTEVVFTAPLDDKQLHQLANGTQYDQGEVFRFNMPDGADTLQVSVPFENIAFYWEVLEK